MGWKKHNIRSQEETDLLGLVAVAMTLSDFLSTMAADLLSLRQVEAATGVTFHPLWERKFLFPSPLGH